MPEEQVQSLESSQLKEAPVSHEKVREYQRYHLYISALCEAPLRVTAKLNEMVQYIMASGKFCLSILGMLGVGLMTVLSTFK